jgi:signal-transduction protein with cAMP-binding, CBS, and nucleotidyltransferase domain
VEENQNHLGNIITKLGIGDSFGEQSLIEQGSLRNASIVADKDVNLELAFLELPAFLSLIGQNTKIKTLNFQQAKDKRIEKEKKAQKESDKHYVRNILHSNLFDSTFFQKWNNVLRDRLSVNSDLVRIEGGGRVVIAKQNDPVEYLYVLLKGTFERTFKEDALIKSQKNNSRSKSKTTAKILRYVKKKFK